MCKVRRHLRRVDHRADDSLGTGVEAPPSCGPVVRRQTNKGVDVVCANAVHQASQLAHLARPVLEIDRYSPAHAWDKVRSEKDRDGEEVRWSEMGSGREERMQARKGES